MVSTTGSSENEESECYICYRMTSRKCSLCNRGRYCSEGCQDQRSGLHLFTCTKRSLTSADYLFQSIVGDVVPDDEDVREKFGFNQLTSFADQCKLGGLYKGLTLSDRITPEDVHKWQVEGTLVANIKEYYYQIPEKFRGGYFPWFLKHTHILERTVSREQATKKVIATFFDQAKPYLDSEDQNKNPKELKPDAKVHCYHMLAMVLNMRYPHPNDENWYRFGFCTCRGEGAESRLAGLYLELLVGEGDKLFDDVPTAHPNLPLQALQERHNFQPATFTEFWQAYQSGTLIQLMDSKLLLRKDFRSDFPFLEAFLSIPPAVVGGPPYPSVWKLKQFVAIGDPAAGHPPIAAPQCDYGFGNCQTFEEVCILMEIYKRLLQHENVDPLELHKACLAGKLFAFAQKYDKMDEDHRRLMKNVYPL